MNPEEAPSPRRLCEHCGASFKALRAGARVLWGSHDGPCGRVCRGSNPEAVSLDGEVHDATCTVCREFRPQGITMPMLVERLRDGALMELDAADGAARMPAGFPTELRGLESERVGDAVIIGTPGSGRCYYVREGHLGAVVRTGEKWLVRTAASWGDPACRVWDAFRYLGYGDSVADAQERYPR